MATTFNYSTMQALRADTGSLTTGDVAIVDGYYDPYDKGGGTYVWDGSSTTAPNDGTVVAPNNKYSGGSGYNASGRWFLVHNGVVNVRQFGALGDGSGDTIADNPDGRFEDSDELRQASLLYPGARGEAFSGLKDSDTIDWCAIQAALIWCGENGARCEAPAGIYTCRRPVWMGDETGNILNEEGDKIVDVMGLTFVGQTGNSRQQADGGVANIRLTSNCTNRYCVSCRGIAFPIGGFKLKVKIGDTVLLTSAIGQTSTATQIATALQSALDSAFPSTYDVTLDVPDTGATLANQNVYLNVRLDSDPTPKFVGEILAVYAGDTDEFTSEFHCFPDSGIVSFRRSAGVNYRLEHLTLAAEGPDQTRYASFGVLFVTTQFFGHILQNIEMAYIDTAVGILKGTGNNGEQTRIDRLHALEVRRMLYTNAPQAFSQEFLGWNGHLQNEYKETEAVEDRDLTDIVFAEFDDAAAPGFGANFYNASATFSDHDHPESDATVVRAKRGTGTVQFVGGRFEHTTRLFNYDAFSYQGINNNMDVVYRGVEFTVVGGGERRLVHGETFDNVDEDADHSTQYGLFVDACTFDTFKDDEHPEYGDLILEAKPLDRARCVFEKSRFMGVRSIQAKPYRAEFVRCFKTDFKGAGSNDTPLRQFTTTMGTPGDRTQSVRTVVQDTPHIQTGPRINILRASDFIDQTVESANENDLVVMAGGANPWVMEGGDEPTKFVFARWGAFTDANIDMSPTSFYLGLQPGNPLTPSNPQRIYNDLTAFSLDEDLTKIATYQCLCQVQGKVRFAIVDSDDMTKVYDEIVIESTAVFSDLTQVTLRAQIKYDAGPEYFRVLIENLSTSGGTNLARIRMMSQQAWGGTEDTVNYPDYPLSLALANSTFAYTDDGAAYKSTYPWSANTLSVRAQSRLKIPSKPRRYGWDQRSLIEDSTADLFDGDTYYDEEMKAVLMVMNKTQMFSIYQPERISTTPSSMDWNAGDVKNILSNGTSGQAIIRLDTDTNNVPDGTVVRIYDKTGTLGTTAVKWGHGAGVADVTIDRNKASEFVFVGGKWRSTWHNITYAAQP